MGLSNGEKKIYTNLGTSCALNGAANINASGAHLFHIKPFGLLLPDTTSGLVLLYSQWPLEGESPADDMPIKRAYANFLADIAEEDSHINQNRKCSFA